MRVAFPVNGPNLMSSNGGWKPRMWSASSWERGGRLDTRTRTHNGEDELTLIHHESPSIITGFQLLYLKVAQYHFYTQQTGAFFDPAL